jgi:hypothetical protein
MRQISQSKAANVMVFMTDSSDHITGKAGLTLTVTSSKDGAAFASISPTVTERGSGWYNVALTSSHTDTLGDLALHITSTGADPTDVLISVISNLPAGIKRNTALSNFMFLMVDSTDHVSGKTGLTVTAQRSLDGASFAACANSVSEVGNGLYRINLVAGDLDADIITLRFTATGADPRVITVITEL